MTIYVPHKNINEVIKRGYGITGGIVVTENGDHRYVMFMVENGSGRLAAATLLKPWDTVKMGLMMFLGSLYTVCSKK